ncbi:MAG: FecR domain-containing protein [Acidobacteria bacterium]|nr:FecR domain-containing protein [Acidobacteriota bacterium]MCZ6727072.1 FecR domain-containing protein [Acidobacteriota bacterium]
MNDSSRFTRTNPSTVETEEEIRHLLRASGPREEIPTGDLEAIRNEARRAWRSMASPEHRAAESRDLRVVALAASLILALAGGWYWSARGLPGAATVEFVRGEVRIEGDVSGSGEVVAGRVLPVGALIETAQATGAVPGRLALRLASGQLRLDAGTRLRLESADRILLERGAIYFDSGPGARPMSGAIEVVTAYGTIHDIGTQFDVRLAASGMALTVRVREGAVALESGAQVRSANRGEALEVSTDGSIALTRIAVDDESWAWAQASAPPFEIEGATLAEFLEWASRETGWAVRYADPALAESARSIGLSGTIEGLTAAEAVSVVLPGSGLAYEIAAGTLQVAHRGGG